MTTNNNSEEPRSVFLVMVTGQIETAQFNESDEIFCIYDFDYGPDWAVTCHVGPEVDSGCTQTSRRSLDTRGIFTFNYPLEITFRSTNPHGWPQLVLSCYGVDPFGNHIPQGYGVCHVPTFPGQHTIKVPVFVPESSSAIHKIMSFIGGKRPEYRVPKLLAQGHGREVTKVRTQGYVNVSMNIVLKDMKKYGYEVMPSQNTELQTESIIGSTLGTKAYGDYSSSK